MSSEIDQIKDRINIVDLVSEYIPLKKAGINHSARCPFHNEKSPSFYVSADRGTYKCFGCGEGGDIFTFVEKMDGIEFRGALQKLATKAGVVLSNNAPKKDEKKDVLQEIMETITLGFQRELGSQESAKEYLKKRGFTKEIVQEYRIGFAPDSWSFAKDYLLEKGFSEQEIERAGIIKTGEKGRSYDRFRSRVVFPLFSIQGAPIAFSGRIFNKDDDSAKYLNSPDTPLFNKSRVLYGMHSAKQSIRKHNFACIVEGQVDLVMAQQVFPNTVATSGTSLTPDHLKLIRRFSDRVVFVFDSDNAGINSAYKGSLLALAQDMEVKIATLPEGSDPADVIVEDPDVYKKAIGSALDVFDFYLSRISKTTTGREQTIAIEDKLFPLLAAVSNPLERDRYFGDISEKLGMSTEALQSRYSQKESKMPQQQNNEPEPKYALETNDSVTPTKRLGHIIAWQESLSPDKRYIDIQDVLGSYNEEVQAQIIKHSKAVEDLNQVAFELENLYKNDIMVQNEIKEIAQSIEKLYSTYRLEKLKAKLSEATISGDKTNQEHIKKEIARLLIKTQ